MKIRFKTTLLLFVSIILIIFNYKTILLWYFEVKEPQTETCETINDYLKNNKWNFGTVYVFKDSLLLNEYFKVNPNIPDAKFFDKDRKFIDYRETPTSCNAGVNTFLNTLDSTRNIYKNKHYKTLDEELNGIVDCDSFKSIKLDTLDYDYYVVFYWAKFIGNLNKTKVFDWKNHIDNLNSKKPGTIKAIYVNCDRLKK